MVRYDEETANRGAKYIDDRRRSGGRRRRGGAPRSGGRGGRAVGGGIGGIIMLILGLVFGIPALSGGGGGSAFSVDDGGFASGGSVEQFGLEQSVDPDADTVAFMQFLMADIQDTWDVYFDQAGLAYQYTNLVIFEDRVSTDGCGNASSAVGPFYCPAPADRQVYIDLGFYDELATRFGAPGDFAQAFVIAHEIGHHIQAITGISDAAREAQAREPSNRNEYSVRQELQADCLAGVWGHSAQGRLTEVTGQPIIEPGDIDEGIRAAAAVGDDRIQGEAGLRIDPSTWTHGSSEQRTRWFKIGFETGDPEACDAFAVDNP